MLRVSGSLEVVTVKVTFVSGRSPSGDLVEIDQSLSDIARSVSDHSGGKARYVPVPLDAGLGIPANHNQLSNGQSSQVRLVKVAAHALMVQIGDFEKQVTGR